MRAMLSVGMIELGPSDNIALDQPRVAIDLIKDLNPDPDVHNWASVGPGVFNTFLLDTGANSVMAMATAVNDMKEPPIVYETDGVFEEVGVGGSHPMDISVSYRFDFAGTTGERNTIHDTRILSDADNDFSMFGPWGIVGMPAMANRVTTMDMRGWSGGGLGLDDLYMKVLFADQVPEGDEHRYALSVDNRLAFDPMDYLVSGDPPIWADIPFFTAIPTSGGIGQEGDFLFDTGAQMSLISSHLGIAIGLDSNGDGMLDHLDDAYLGTETIGGVGGTKAVSIFAIDEVRVPVAKVSTGQTVELVWTDLQWLVLDIDVGEGQVLDGVFGSDLLTSGWFHAFFYPGQPDGYIDQIHLDFRGWGLDTGTPQSRNGTVYFDLNAGVDNIIEPGPGIRIRETLRSTEVIKEVSTDTYSIGLQTDPTAPVQITVTAEAPVLVSSDGGQTYSSILVVTLGDTAPQTITVMAEDDGLIDGPRTRLITHTVASADPDYHNISVRDVAVKVFDNREVVTITADQAGQQAITSIAVAEGGSELTYWISLASPPVDQLSETWVVVENPGPQVTVFNPNNEFGDGGENLWIFSSENWNQPQPVQVSAIDDDVPEGPHQTQLIHTVLDLSQSDPNLGQQFLTVSITDNDLGSVVITETGGSTQITEGGATDTYQIALVPAPAGPVELTLTADSQTEVSADDGATFASTLVLAFTDATPQTITVRAVDDQVAEGTHAGNITHSITGTVNDPMYPTTLAIADVTATITDNDFAGLLTAADPQGEPAIDSVSVERGGETRYWMALTSQPQHNVKVFLSSAGEELAVVPDAAPDQSYLEFSPLDWHVPQAVRVTASVDGLVEGPYSVAITHRLFSSDPNYQGTGLLTVNVAAADLIVTSLTATSAGLEIHFNQDLDVSVLNLYDQGGVFGPADLTLIGDAIGEVRGSLVIGPTLREATFIKTDGILLPDTYTVTLRSAADGWKDVHGQSLDGNQGGTSGGHFVTTFTVEPPDAAAITVSLPNVTRGRGQPVNLPAEDLTAGLPLSVSNGFGVGRVQLELRYDTRLLNIATFHLAPSIVERDGAYVLEVSTPGVAVLTIMASSGLADAAGPLIVGSFAAQVPDDAPFGEKHILDIEALRVFDNSTSPAELPAIDGDAIHVAAFLGDANGDGTYNSPDATLTRRIIGQMNTGLGAFPLADPVLIADITLDNGIQSNDTTAIRRAIGLMHVPYIPALPEGLTAIAATGPDPRVYIPQDLVGAAGQTVTVPVMIEVTEPAGVSIGAFDLMIEFDPSRFTVTGAQRGSLLAGTDLVGVLTQPAPGRLIYAADSLIGTANFPLGTVGTLVTLSMTVAPDAAPGPAVWNLLAGLGPGRTGIYDTELQELVLNPAPTNAASDAVDGLFLVSDGTPPWQNPIDPLDVNADGVVTALDVLLLVNYLNAQSGSSSPAPNPMLQAMYADVNGDGHCTPQDALVVINHLNTQIPAAPEGESGRSVLPPSPTADGDDDWEQLLSLLAGDPEVEVDSES